MASEILYVAQVSTKSKKFMNIKFSAQKIKQITGLHCSINVGRLNILADMENMMPFLKYFDYL